ncbi:MAG: hypothetical protein VKL42_12550 [Snowella sp.]|nr:hypothetical protein [Snowella sp.]
MINPAFIFQPDCIYDLLWMQRCDSRINNLIANVFANHSPFVYGQSLPLVFVQRFDCLELPWSDDWTTQTFQLFKKLSRTWLLTNGEINGSDYGIEPRYKATLPSHLSFPDFPDQVTLKVHAGETVSISWLRRAHAITSDTCFDEVTNEVTAWIRAGEVFVARDDDLSFVLDSSDWLFNSCVIAGDGLLVGITEDQKKLIMYDYLGQTLDSIHEQLQLPSCEVLTGITAKVVTGFSTDRAINFIQDTSGVNPTAGTWAQPVARPDKISFMLPVFQQVPDSYHYAYLVYADNNYWQNGSIPSGNQRMPSVLYYADTNSLQVRDYLRSPFDDWRSGIVETDPVGYDIHRDGFQVPPPWARELIYSLPKVIELGFPGALGSFGDLNVFTTTDNQPLDQPWFTYNGSVDYGAINFKYSTYPILEGSWRNQCPVDADPPVNKKLLRFPFMHEAVSKFPPIIINNSATPLYSPDYPVLGVDYYSISDPFKQYPYDRERPPGGYYDSRFCYFRNSITRQKYFNDGSGLSGEGMWREVEILVYDGRPDSVCIPFFGDQDYNLFSDGQVVIVRNSLDNQLRYYVQQWPGEGGALDISPDWDITLWIDRKEFTNKQLISVNVDVTNPSSPVIGHSIVTNEQAQIYSGSATPGNVFESKEGLPDDWPVRPLPAWTTDYVDTIIEQDVLLNRSLRIVPLSPSNLKFQAVDGKQVISSLSDAQFQSVVESLWVRADMEVVYAN